MRRAVITTRWEGPDKLVREMIDDALDKLFFDLTMTGKVQAADTQIEFTSRVKEVSTQ